MSQEIDKVIQRTQRYYYEDGLVETAVGLLFFVIGLALLGWLTIQSNPTLGIVMVLVSVLLIFGGTLFVQKTIPYLKERLTHPRTGKVVYKQNEPPRSRWFIGLPILVVLFLALFLPERFQQIALMEGALLGFVLVYLGYRVNLRRFYIMGTAALLMGLAGANWFNNEITSSAFTFGSIGLIMLISGLIMLTQYLRRHPIVEADYE